MGTRWCSDTVESGTDGHFEISESVHRSVCGVRLHARAAGFDGAEVDAEKCPGVNAPIEVTLEPLPNLR